MGHGGMLYSLPSRDLIADSVEYMVNAHCADALICISNCDKITPGMLNAALRLNIPTVFVSGGPMEGGDGDARRRHRAQAREPDHRDGRRRRRRASATRTSRPDRGGRLPDVRLLLGHVHRQLDELPDRGARPRAAGQRLDARDAHRAPAALRGRRPHRRRDRARATTTRTTTSRAAARDRHARGVRERDDARHRDGRLDQHRSCTCSPPRRRPSVDFTMADIDALSRRVPVHLQGRAERHLPDGGRAPRRRDPRDPRRAAPRRAAPRATSRPSTRATLDEWLGDVGRARRRSRPSARSSCSTPRPAACARPEPSRSPSAGSRSTSTPPTAASTTSSTPTRTDGGLAILYGNLAERRLRREDGRRRRVDPERSPGPARRGRVPGGGGRADPRAAASAPATWS